MAGFTAPVAWPQKLAQQWKTTVGTGDATPALVGDKLYVFARQGADEITFCLDAAKGMVLWQDKYPANVTINGPAGGHPGPRSSPAFADGKIVTLGAGGVLSCLDADTGKVVWRKDSGKDFSLAVPMFYISSSPMLVDGLCVAHLGGRGKGAVVAFDLNTGETKWKWEGDGPAYASPALMTVEGSKQLVEVTERSVVGLVWPTANSSGKPPSAVEAGAGECAVGAAGCAAGRAAAAIPPALRVEHPAARARPERAAPPAARPAPGRAGRRRAADRAGPGGNRGFGRGGPGGGGGGGGGGEAAESYNAPRPSSTAKPSS